MLYSATKAAIKLNITVLDWAIHRQPAAHALCHLSSRAISGKQFQKGPLSEAHELLNLLLI